MLSASLTALLFCWSFTLTAVIVWFALVLAIAATQAVGRAVRSMLL